MSEPDYSKIVQELGEYCARVGDLLEHLRDDSLVGVDEAVEGPRRVLGEALQRLDDLCGIPEEAHGSTDPENDAALPTIGKGRNCGLRGSSSCLSVTEILAFLSSHHKTGTLRVCSGRETFTLEIHSGDVVHACTDSSREDQLLGSILVARDSISTAALEEFFKCFTSADGMIGDALEHAQLVSRADLQEALEHQVQELFHRLFHADPASFFFYEGGERTLEQRIRMNITQLLLESARNTDEAIHAG